MAVESTMLPLRTEAEDFSLPDPTGRLWSLADVAGTTGTLVVFACNHCPYVQYIAPVLSTTVQRWHAAGIGVIAINSNDVDAYPEDAAERMPEYAAQWGWTFPYVSDHDQSVARAYRAACTPDFYLFDAARLLVYRGRFDGASPGNAVEATGAELDAAVSALLSDRVLDDQIPSIGCSIKWRPGHEPDWFG